MCTGIWSNTAEITLIVPLPLAPQGADTLVLSVGCDKRFATCRDRFFNQLNFRGFYPSRLTTKHLITLIMRPFLMVHRLSHSADPLEVVRAARSWIGTPYRHQGTLKHVGCDCLGLVLGSLSELGGATTQPPPTVFARLGRVLDRR
ncbi:MAG: phage BR0599 family protein [Ahrensia sp.]|nr:phage BR0599 family protein [Ahrensia sp.]